MKCSFMVSRKQYIQLAKVLDCKLPTISKPIPNFPHRVRGLKADLTGYHCTTVATTRVLKDRGEQGCCKVRG